MVTRHGKILFFLLTFVVLVGLILTGCTSATVPKGWSGAAISDNVLIIGSMAGDVVSLNAQELQPKWALFSLRITQPAGSFGCAPAAAAVAIYGTPTILQSNSSDYLVYVCGYNGKVYAINFSTNGGTERWVYPRENYIPAIVGGSVLTSGKLVFGSSDGNVYALDAPTGDFTWKFKTDSKIWATPAVQDDTVFIGSFDDKFYALKVSDGSKVWEYNTGGAIIATPLVDDDTVYVGSFDRNLYALNISNGSLKWKFQGNNWFWAKPVVSNGIIYAGCLDGHVYALDAITGNLVVDFNLGKPVSSSLVSVNGTVFAATETGVLYSLDAETRESKQITQIGQTVKAPLVASGTTIYVHAANDMLYAVDAQTGAKRNYSLTGK